MFIGEWDKVEFVLLGYGFNIKCSVCFFIRNGGGGFVFGMCKVVGCIQVLFGKICFCQKV